MLSPAADDFLTTSAIEQALFQSTYLKYWDDTEQETVIVSNKDEVHAEILMLANVYRNAWIEIELRRQKLQAKLEKECSKEKKHQDSRIGFYYESKDQWKQLKD